MELLIEIPRCTGSSGQHVVSSTPPYNPMKELENEVLNFDEVSAEIKVTC